MGIVTTASRQARVVSDTDNAVEARARWVYVSEILPIGYAATLNRAINHVARRQFDEGREEPAKSGDERRRTRWKSMERRSLPTTATAEW
jgi:hypothetical protein